MTEHKNIIIYVRGRQHEFPEEKISYSQVVDLAYPTGKRGPLYEYDASWKDGPKDSPEGILKEGETVPVVDEMKFDVKFTDKS